MDIKKYIESGILEEYVLGHSNDPDVERMAAQYPEIQKAIAEIEKTLESYAQLHSIKPPTGVFEEIWKKTEANSKSSRTIKKWRGYTSGLSILLIAAIGLSYWFYHQNQDCQQTLQDHQAQISILQQNTEVLQNNYVGLEEQIETYRNVENKRINLAGTDIAPTSVASVYYNTKDNKTWLDVLSLPSPPAGKQYQLWAIIGGVPQDMGVFNLAINTEEHLKSVPFLADAEAFAVTLEDLGGVASPTLEQMCLIGNVS